MPFHYVTSFIDPAFLNLFHGAQNLLTGRAFATDLARNMSEVEKTSLWKGTRIKFAWVWFSAPVVFEGQPTWESCASSCVTDLAGYSGRRQRRRHYRSVLRGGWHDHRRHD